MSKVVPQAGLNPLSSRTEIVPAIVAVPTLLTSHAGVDEQIDELEIHHLASLEGDVHFALLSDWADADSAVGDSE